VVTRPRRSWPWIRRTRKERDQAASWLRCAMLALAALALAAAVVSFAAQFKLVYAFKHSPAIAALQAGIPDAGALVFASLGIALALQGRRAIRARILNVACVGISVAMNAIAAAPGWRGLAIWIMAPVLYALASDTLIGVIRAWSIARQKALAEALDEDEATPLAILAGVLLWLLRLALAPPSTVLGFRRWVIEECPVAPGRTQAVAAAPPARPISLPRTAAAAAPRDGTKTSRFLALVEDRYGSLATVPVDQVSPICAELAAEADLDAGSARTALRRAVLAAQNGHGGAS